MDYFTEKNIKNILYASMPRKLKSSEIIDKFNEIANTISNKFGDRTTYINIILAINERIPAMEKAWVYSKLLEKILKELYEGLTEVNRLTKIYQLICNWSLLNIDNREDTKLVNFSLNEYMEYDRIFEYKYLMDKATKSINKLGTKSPEMNLYIDLVRDCNEYAMVQLDKKGRAREFYENNLLLSYLAWLSKKELDELLPNVSYLDISSDIATLAFNNLLRE
ncbi:Mbov_0392 family ICE element protein [Mycoplasmopsis agalactiae]|uniref:CDS11 n=1 Tax=Mycoplasmopsis agalactiae TaxID=2110 RepID=D3VQC2_MYCAA|nr:hypothetical protein [Mycoplasmopsis agalactiae]KAB6718637.1 hypothetical protein E4L58_01895 [Mycoplasmopsis agalactiae]CAJ32606.1 CDS11 [Mycoplasmopsis agalactiae]CBH40516.1 CDS11 [Mycoplasmopsis agalactiae]CBH40698.1 CDS11 [Mycoplasmopsis agalactiae]CBH40910.1 CDS11 [Mycoplasmopsis agalactiae]